MPSSFLQYINHIVVIGFISLGNRIEYPKESNEVFDKLYHIMLYRVKFTNRGFELTILVMIGTDCIGNCKPNCHKMTTTMNSSKFQYIKYRNGVKINTYTWPPVVPSWYGNFNKSGGVKPVICTFLFVVCCCCCIFSLYYIQIHYVNKYMCI
jgi:hypothetical protein